MKGIAPAPKQSMNVSQATDFVEKFTIMASKLFAWISGACVVAMMLLIVINGIKRAVSTPILGTTEVVGWLAAVSISFALGYSQLHRAHVAIDLLVVKFPKALQKALRIVISFVSLVFFIIVGWQLFKYALVLANNKNVSQTLGIVFYPFVMLTALGFLVFVLALVQDFISECKGGRRV